MQTNLKTKQDANTFKICLAWKGSMKEKNSRLILVYYRIPITYSGLSFVNSIT